MQAIDVHDLPDPVAEALAETVRRLREQLNKNGETHTQRPLSWALGTIGKLRRNEIYDDHLDGKLHTRGSRH